MITCWLTVKQLTLRVSSHPRRLVLDSALLRDVVEDNRALLDVMVSRVMLCAVVSLVLTARSPENPELFLCLAVL